MGMLVDGVWQDQDLEEFKRDGKNVRFSSGFHDPVTADGSGEFPAEPGRYALYYNRTCPWSHRASLTLELKGLTKVIDQVFLDPAMGPQCWWFGETGEYRDPAMNATHLHELYSAADPKFTGRVSVPILWDKKSQSIVNNDSGALARLFNNEFNACAECPEVDFYPEQLRPEIDQLNELVADRLNDGVYKCLLAANQTDYEMAFDQLFETLENFENRLGQQRYLLGAEPTEPDWRLFACLVRFDAVYYALYKCNYQRIVDYPNLWAYTRDLYQIPGVAKTVDIDRIKSGYYGTVARRGLGNAIVPKGPRLDFDEPHGRERLSRGTSEKQGRFFQRNL